uniref:Endonuclease/exonuclease/phosphatase domain-containing protein n=1 Tax=Oryzias sinensis TaxID=183150 RepID=A0A8C8DHD2_9TELE
TELGYFMSGVFDNVTLRVTDPAGRMLIVEFEWARKKMRLLNLYASNDEKERQIFFRSLRPFVTEDSLLVGDLNTVLSPADVSVRNVFKTDFGRQELFSVMMDYNLVDVWRLLNPGKRVFSRRQMVMGVLKQSRIPCFFCWRGDTFG